MTSLNDCILLMLECIQFDGLMQRHQHLARELGRFLPVIYVEDTPSRLRRFFDGRPFDPALTEYKLGLRDVGGNVRLFKAPPYVPRSTGYRRAMEGSARRVAKHLKPLLPADRKIITWIMSPIGLRTIGMYDEVLSIFDCYDAFGEFPGETRYRDQIIAATNEMAEKVDIVVTTNEELRARLAGHNPNTVIVQNGCDPDHFATGGRVPSPGKAVVDIDSLPKPILGYMGDVAPWVELDHLLLAAKRHPEWSILIVGTWKRDGKPPRGLPNVYIPGRVPYDELPYYARAFDVGTIPFALTDLTRVVNPLKLYEYFAMGKPVVSTPLPEVARHEDLVYLAGNPDEFVALAEVAMKESADSPARPRRIQVARENSWKSRGESIKELLEEAPAGRMPSKSREEPA